MPSKQMLLNSASVDLAPFIVPVRSEDIGEI